MSLTTVVEAFVLVAVVFNAAGLLTARWANRGPGLLSRVWPGATF